MPYESKYIWMDGKLVDYANATVHVLSPTLHYGMGAFEGLRCYDTARGPAVFRLVEHMERLVDSANIFGFRKLPFTIDELCVGVKETVKANGFKECYIRPLLYQALPNMSLNVDNGAVNIAIAAWEWDNYLGDEGLEKGIRANISTFTRHHPNVMMTKSKITGNYANSILAKTESTRLGFEEAIMLDPQGYVAECTGENIFLVRNGVIFTPFDAVILQGITRDALVTLAGDLAYKVVEQPISRDQLYTADEVFVSGTAAECIPIREIDFRVIGSGKAGPVTRALQKAFHAAIHGDHPRSAGWLDYVDA
jgi:branched-chain amino acid aminotransferase